MQNENILMERLESDYLEPPADDEPMEYCSKCGTPLYLGDTAWDFDGILYCDDCAKFLYRKTIDYD